MHLGPFKTFHLNRSRVFPHHCSGFKPRHFCLNLSPVSPNVSNVGTLDVSVTNVVRKTHFQRFSGNFYEGVDLKKKKKSSFSFKSLVVKMSQSEVYSIRSVIRNIHLWKEPPPQGQI